MARYHILIVDDQREVRLLLRAGLETLKLDLAVTDVPSAEEALLILGKEQIDLMVVDVRLPGMSGLELHHRAGKRTPTTQLILITGMTDEKVLRQVAEAGAAAYFYKPIQIDLFLDEVCKCLGVQPAVANTSLKTQPASPPANLPPSPDNLWDKFYAQQDALGGWILNAQRETLHKWGNMGSQEETQVLEKLMLSLLKQDNNLIQSSPGLMFPCHHQFAGKGHDLWIVSLGPELVLSILLPAGTGAQRATQILTEISQLPASFATAGMDGGGPPIRSATDQAEEGIDLKLSALLGQAFEQGLQPGELSAFWDRLAQEDQIIQTGHGLMTYEEAVRMGLAKGGHFA